MKRTFWLERDKWRVKQYLAMGYSDVDCAIFMRTTLSTMRTLIKSIKKERGI